MPYIMIENRVNEIPSVELMRMLGASASRANSHRIGQFGSGFPYSLALLARYGLLDTLKLCLGREVYTFTTVDTAVKDSNGNQTIQSEIVMKKQNGGTTNLNISTEFGALDWTDITMALREFVSNACDGAESFDGTYGSVVIDTNIPEEGRNTRAKDGYIRIYIKSTPDIRDYLENIRDTFICLRPGYSGDRKISFNPSQEPARVCRKGVVVGRFGNKSLFHYNIDNIHLNESRLVDSANARKSCAEEIGRCKNRQVVTKFIQFLMLDEPLRQQYFEGYLYDWDYRPEFNSGDVPLWTECLRDVVGESIPCENSVTANLVTQKGYHAIVNSTIYKMSKTYGIRTAQDVLNQHELQGREIIAPTEQVLSTLDFVWTYLDLAGMTGGRDKPGVACFRQNTSSTMLGYYRPADSNMIYIRDDISHDSGLMLRSVVLEECVHYVTKADDYSRTFQDFTCKLAAYLMV